MKYQISLLHIRQSATYSPFCLLYIYISNTQEDNNYANKTKNAQQTEQLSTAQSTKGRGQRAWCSHQHDLLIVSKEQHLLEVPSQVFVAVQVLVLSQVPIGRAPQDMLLAVHRRTVIAFPEGFLVSRVIFKI